MNSFTNVYALEQVNRPEKIVRRIFRVCSQDELDSLAQKGLDEDMVLRVCREKVAERNLDMKVFSPLIFLMID